MEKAVISLLSKCGFPYETNESLLAEMRATLDGEKRPSTWSTPVKVAMPKSHCGKSTQSAYSSKIITTPKVGFIRHAYRSSDLKLRMSLTRSGCKRVYSNWHPTQEEAFSCIIRKIWPKECDALAGKSSASSSTDPPGGDEPDSGMQCTKMKPVRIGETMLEAMRAAKEGDALAELIDDEPGSGMQCHGRDNGGGGFSNRSNRWRAGTLIAGMSAGMGGDSDSA